MGLSEDHPEASLGPECSSTGNNKHTSICLCNIIASGCNWRCWLYGIWSDYLWDHITPLSSICLGTVSISSVDVLQVPSIKQFHLSDLEACLLCHIICPLEWFQLVKINPILSSFILWKHWTIIWDKVFLLVDECICCQ